VKWGTFIRLIASFSCAEGFFLRGCWWVVTLMAWARESRMCAVVASTAPASVGKLSRRSAAAFSLERRALVTGLPLDLMSWGNRSRRCMPFPTQGKAGIASDVDTGWWSDTNMPVRMAECVIGQMECKARDTSM
jgi:hypothetical protein